MKPLEGRRILVTGGTGSLGKVLVRRLLSGEMGEPESVTVFSRDEAKQYYMRMAYQQKTAATEDIAYNIDKVLKFVIGDVRDLNSVKAVVRKASTIFNAAALKQVPSCEYAPYEAVQTNITGAENIVRALEQNGNTPELVVGISTDKACKPINVMGMTKAIQERIFIQANLRWPMTRFVCVRYGNVLTSRGSVIPLFLEQIKNGGPVTITSEKMTRFLLSLDDAVDTVFAAVRGAGPGETYIAKVPAARVTDIARVLIDSRAIETSVIGIRPGEKLHESLISSEEALRTIDVGKYYSILPSLPEFDSPAPAVLALAGEYRSAYNTIGLTELGTLLRAKVGNYED